eukprot:TRINITY_DN2205_c1_g1_i1.p1 TRINITY_DN2205_c1_g1~~TRINITY_DN2205_c1_g1_i1.p1  ORF type:complete len:351 (+),score=84.72 TRINITY_DN2205_c1_g1_i1:110-1162(+)
MDDDWEEWDPSKGSFVHHMIAGSCAGLMEHAAMFPVDTLKTHLQATGSIKEIKMLMRRPKKLQNMTVGTMPRPCPNKMMNSSLKNSLKPEWLKQRCKNFNMANRFRLWRGVSSMFIGCVPSHAAYFSIYESAKQILGANKEGHHPIAAGSAGIIATLAHDAIITPMDVIKQRLQLGFYNNVPDAMRTIIRTEGLKAFYVSYPITLAMNVPFAALMVAANESSKTILSGGNSENCSMPVYFTSGAIAGAFAGALTNPLDVIKTKLQTQSVICSCPRLQNTIELEAASNPALNGFKEAAAHIMKTGGYRGFLNGIIPRTVFHSSSWAIAWATYEFIKKSLRPSKPIDKNKKF